jgi:hypothetical protein
LCFQYGRRSSHLGCGKPLVFDRLLPLPQKIWIIHSSCSSDVARKRKVNRCLPGWTDVLGENIVPPDPTFGGRGGGGIKIIHFTFSANRRNKIGKYTEQYYCKKNLAESIFSHKHNVLNHQNQCVQHENSIY